MIFIKNVAEAKTLYQSQYLNKRYCSISQVSVITHQSSLISRDWKVFQHFLSKRSEAEGRAEQRIYTFGGEPFCLSFFVLSLKKRFIHSKISNPLGHESTFCSASKYVSFLKKNFHAQEISQSQRVLFCKRCLKICVFTL